LLLGMVISHSGRIGLDEAEVAAAPDVIAASLWLGSLKPKSRTQDY